ncbi:MAG: hypothetical protein AMS26_05800 [Bacteroides sp. SM23_62]|nr:MAG: hypothetical protein AMS26_05800 [Bacteroides sp. SM23_62]
MFFYHTGNLYFSGICMGRSVTVTIRLLYSGISFFLVLSGHAQFYNQGEDPGNLRWRQIRTGHFRVIYPEDFDAEAQRLTNILEHYYEPNAAYLDHKPSQIPVILHNHSVRSNGFVAWAPKRMELVTTPSPHLYAHDYLEQLALHEFRHVVQVDKLKQGFTKGLSYITGEMGIGAVAGMMPFWFLEGDAVDAETRLSHAGRGRLPSFEMEIKAILAEIPGLYSYEKATMGSYRDYVPDHYQYGYQMVAHARNKYQKDFWGKMVGYTARNPYTIYPFYFGLRKFGGSSKVGLYKETFEILRTHWASRDSLRSLTQSKQLNQRNSRHFTGYRFPRYVNDSLVFAEKSGIDQINEFVVIDRDGNEKRIHRPGFYNPANISVGSGKVVWTEIIPDARWAKRDFSIIKVFNMKTRKEKMLTWKSRYFAPDLSPDARLVVAIEADLQNQYFLVVINEMNGEVVQRIPSPGNHYLQFPVWAVDQQGIYVTALGTSGKKIMYYDLARSAWKTLFNAGFKDIAELYAGADYLIFRGTFSGIDNIYALDLETNECQRVTSSRFGAFMPCLSSNGDRLIYADYTSQGFNVVESAFEPGRFVPLEEVIDDGEQLNVPSPEETSKVPEPSMQMPENFESRPYRKFSNLFNFHSWIPLYFDVDDPSIEEIPVTPGVMVFSQNRMSTATTKLGYEYRDREHFFHAAFTYSGWYPVFKLSCDFGGTPFVDSVPNVEKPSTVSTDISLDLEVSLPLDLTTSRWVVGIRPSVESRYSRAYFYYNTQNAYKRGMTFLDYRLYAYNYLKKAYRDILPRAGQVFDIRYVDTPFEEGQLGSTIAGTAVIYFPGLLRHQTLKILGAAQKQTPGNYLMGNLVSMPRGFQNHTAVGLQKITFDYVFPLFYPDWNIWRAAYFKRFRGAVFYDHAWGQDVHIPHREDVPVDREFRSLGLELTTDVHLAQFLFPFNMGGRVIYLPDTRYTRAEFVFTIDLNQFY